MNKILGLDKSNIIRSFAKASVSYDEFATLQRTVGSALLTMLDATKPSGVILELGCGTGFLTQRLNQIDGDKSIVAMDIALPMLEVANRKSDSHFFCADIESLPVNTGTIDWIFSNLALQWCTDLPAVFSEFRRVLKPDGQFLFSTFGSSTFQELKQAWAVVDDYSHVNDFFSMNQIHKSLELAGFTGLQIKNCKERSFYPDVLTLMREIKGIGAHNVTQNRKKNLTTRKQLNHLITAYEKFRVNDFLPATYDVIYAAGKAE